MPDVVWAPWRMGYILTADSSGCFLCEKASEVDDRSNLILTRSQSCIVLLNLFPYNNGHLLIAPYRHVARLQDLTAEECGELMGLAQRWEVALSERMNPHGFNVGLNLGRVAGAGLESHLHLHVVPRWHGDTNFMPVVSDTKVMPQSLAALYDLLAGAVVG